MPNDRTINNRIRPLGRSFHGRHPAKLSGDAAVRGPAFTLVEVLVVVAILGILIALLLPAIQAARESSRRITCQNNMRQVGIALLGFEAANKVYPASGWTEPGPGNPDGKYVGWRALLLPFIDLSNLRARYDFSLQWWEGDNLLTGATQIDIYLCPSVSERRPATEAIAHPPRPAMTFPEPLAPIDYEAMMGVRSVINPDLYDSSRTNRSVMFRNSAISTAEIVDGMTRTIAIVECAARPLTYRNGRIVPDVPNDQGQGWIDSEGSFSLDGASPDGTMQGISPTETPVAMNATNENEPYAFHSGGGNFIFADGHVEFISESISLHNLAALSTRAGGEFAEP